MNTQVRRCIKWQEKILSSYNNLLLIKMNLDVIYEIEVIFERLFTTRVSTLTSVNIP